MTYYKTIKNDNNKGGRGALDLAGRKFNMLTALYVAEPSNGSGDGNGWQCLCECGNTVVRKTSKLTNGEAFSCGCTRRPYRVKTAPKPVEVKPKRENPLKGQPELVRNRLVSRYHGMKSRCHNPEHPQFKDYGGRGIAVCDEWLNDSFTFYKWALENGYALGLTIDRRDNDGNYEPSNCRWVDNKTNCRNRRSTKLTPEKAAEIKQALDLGEQPIKIAARFGLRPHFVYNIKNNGAWSDTPRHYYKENGLPFPYQWKKKGDSE